MTSVSRQIYDTTKGRGRFGEIEIIVPSSWSGEECLKSRYLTRSAGFSDRGNGAAFTVDNPHPIFGIEPRTDQYGHCGIGGLGVHLPYPILVGEVRISEKSSKSTK